ncbi:deoxyribose-phosphate aldolase [Marinilabiliaceae bacterium JC017]|nr:deoxyribose-phosphate aldolase [Marinilabiliaceae bacterium JC017]
MNFSIDKMIDRVNEIKQKSQSLKTETVVLKKIFNCIDLTTLNSTDSSFSVNELVEKVNKFKSEYPGMPEVAAMCVYPVFAPVLKGSLKCDSVRRAVVSGGFPASQTFSDLKKMETQKALDFDVDEVDIVISVGEFLEGNYEFVGEEIVMIKEIMGEAHLKVILETGALKDPEEIWMASILAMETGADFIKTSTGKLEPAATPEAGFVMVNAIKTFYEKNGTKIGFKAAGGISTTEDALFYYQLVKDVLGEEWLNNKLFRIGASRLANNLLTDVINIEKGSSFDIKYF